LANDPALVLADEPTGNLDDQSAQRVMGLLTSAVREHGRTLLLVTHERDTAQTADKRLELRGGVVTSVREMNSSDDLCEGGWIEAIDVNTGQSTKVW